jgi:hypothetical protein
MVKLTSFVLISVFAFVLCSPVAFAARSEDWCDDSINFGTHPWDIRPKRNYEYSRVDPYKYSKDYFYMHPDRSKTHALHPYHRNRYYAPAVDADLARYSNRRISDTRYSQDRAYYPKVDKLTYCNSYSFSRPNYRIPPYEYWCSN